MKKEFKLIELLAVIVILAIIALIATPIILGIIEDARNEAKVRSAELYLTAVEQAIMRKKMNDDISFNPIECVVEDNNTLDCNTGELLVDVDEENITSGYIKLNNGKIELYNLIVDGEEQTNIEETDEGCFTIEENGDNTVTITDYTCGNSSEMYISDVIIPKMINGKLVTIIGAGSFYNMGLTSVLIPNSVVEIEWDVFSLNNLKTIVIPGNVLDIGDEAFAACGLTSVKLQYGVESIAGSAFASNNLTSIVIPASVLSIGNYSFGWQSIKDVTIKNENGYVYFACDSGDECFPFGDNFDINDIKWQP